MNRAVITVYPEMDETFESCNDCVHCDDTEEICRLRRCVHAFYSLRECYVPKSGKEQRSD